MIKSLHHYRSIIKEHGTPVDKRLVGDTVILVITINKSDLVAIKYQATQAIAANNPYIMRIIFLNTMDDIIQQTITTGYELR
jgi:hypothetical protein